MSRRPSPYPPDNRGVRHFAPSPPEANKLTGMSRADVTRKYGSGDGRTAKSRADVARKSGGGGTTTKVAKATQPPTPAPPVIEEKSKPAGERAQKAGAQSTQFDRLPRADQAIITLLRDAYPAHGDGPSFGSPEFFDEPIKVLMSKISPSQWKAACKEHRLKFRPLNRYAVGRAHISARKLLRAGKLLR